VVQHLDRHALARGDHQRGLRWASIRHFQRPGHTAPHGAWPEGSTRCFTSGALRPAATKGGDRFEGDGFKARDRDRRRIFSGLRGERRDTRRTGRGENDSPVRCPACPSTWREDWIGTIPRKINQARRALGGDWRGAEDRGERRQAAEQDAPSTATDGAGEPTEIHPENWRRGTRR